MTEKKHTITTLRDESVSSLVKGLYDKIAELREENQQLEADNRALHERNEMLNAQLRNLRRLANEIYMEGSE